MKTLASSPELGNATPSSLINEAITSRALGPANANRLLFANECGLEIDNSTLEKIHEVSVEDISRFHQITNHVLPLLRVAEDFQTGDRIRFQSQEKGASPSAYEITKITESSSRDEDPMESTTLPLFDREDFVSINTGSNLIHEVIGVRWPSLVPLELSDSLKNIADDRRTHSEARITSRFGIFYFRMSFFSELVYTDIPYKNAIYRSLRWHRLVPPKRLK
jgi:hypothetical protein